VIARLHIEAPFEIALPRDAQFGLYDYEDDGCNIRLYPPVRNAAESTSDVGEIRIDDQESVRCSILRIDFVKEQFGGSEEAPDPSAELVGRALDSYIERLRYITRAAHLRPIPFPMSSWRIEYLTDDGHPLGDDESSPRDRGGLKMNLQWIILTPEMWSDLNELGPEFSAPPWVSLLHDATDALPEVGPAIVLAYTAIEVCIAAVLQQEAPHSSIPSSLWAWINKRGDWSKEPSTAEQLDQVSESVLGASMKGEQELWTAFQNLKRARNEFVHQGLARIGKQPVSQAHAGQLVAGATKILGWIRDRLPNDRKWPEHIYEHKVAVASRAIEVNPPEDQQAKTADEPRPE